jgi:Bacterial surface proteins containing Ig-like domains
MVNKRYFLEISVAQFRKILFIGTFSLFILLQIVFAGQAFALSSNDTVIIPTTSKSILSSSLFDREKTSIPVTGIELNKSSLTLKIRASETLKATLTPANATNKTVYWDSSDNSIAKVGLETGKVIAVKTGTATITAYTEDGNLTAMCDVTVFNPDIVTFADINLENAIRKNIDKTTGDLLKTDVRNITALDAVNDSISDLSGIENLTNLKRLDLNSNQVNDLSNLQHLTRLSTLNLSNNQLTNIDIIGKLKSLTSLNLSGNQIDDISSLDQLTKLTTFNLRNNQISDISILKKFTNLTNLYLDQNQISNINPLKVLNKLKYLYLTQNPISESDIKTLRNAIPRCRITY